MALSPILDFKTLNLPYSKVMFRGMTPARLNFFCSEDDFDGSGGFIAWWVWD